MPRIDNAARTYSYICFFANGVDHTYNFVPHREGQFHANTFKRNALTVSQIERAMLNVKIAVTDTTCLDLHANLVAKGDGRIPNDELEWLSPFGNVVALHALLSECR